MGTWKMAKAFGRAIANKGKDSAIKHDVLESMKEDSRTAYVNRDKDALDRADAVSRGVREGNEDMFDAQLAADDIISSGAPEKARGALEEKIYDKYSDVYTDRSLQKDFQDAFDDAAERHGYKKWREESKDTPLDDGFGGDMHDVNRMDAEQRVREEMIRDKHTLSDDEFIDKWFNK